MIYLNRKAMRALSETAAWVARRRQRIRVAGDSMLPTLRDGQFVLLDPGRRPAAGELTVADHPDEDELLVVKRVAAILDNGRYELVSDNPEAGTDSRRWGPVPADRIHGTVTLILGEPFGL